MTRYDAYSLLENVEMNYLRVVLLYIWKIVLNIYASLELCFDFKCMLMNNPMMGVDGVGCSHRRNSTKKIVIDIDRM